MTRAFIALGANLGDRAATMRGALDLLAADDVAVLRRSSVYATDPVGFTDQPEFLNAAAEIDTSLDAAALLARMAGVEQTLGKATPFVDGPRTIDLDLLLFGDEHSDTPDLAIPHPRLHQRRFVLVPLAEIAPDVVHPALGDTIAALLNLLPPGETVRPSNETL